MSLRIRALEPDLDIRPPPDMEYALPPESPDAAHKATTPRRRRRRLVVVALLIAVALLGVGALLFGTGRDCAAVAPRVASHRGFDAELDRPRGAGTLSAVSVTALLDRGVRAYDIDVFWVDDDVSSTLYVGHPASLRMLWDLPAPPLLTPIADLRAKSSGGLWSLGDLLALVRTNRARVDFVSLELKYPNDRAWRQRLGAMYAAIRDAGVADLCAIVADADAVADHASAQLEAGVRVGLHLLLRDADAPRYRDGARADANVSSTLAAGAALGVRYDALTASAALLGPGLLSEARSVPVVAWVVDDETALALAYRLRIHAVISNRPTWAMRTLERWRSDACGRGGAFGARGMLGFGARGGEG